MSLVTYECDEHIATITLNRPDRMNTISGPMLGALSERLLEADAARDVRCIVLTGAGRAFCAGLDLAAQMSSSSGSLGGLGSLDSNPGEFALRDAPPIVLHNLDTPTICALNGGAAGYGLDIALAYPTIRGSSHVPPLSGRMPRLAKPGFSLAVEAATRMSQPKAMSNP